MQIVRKVQNQVPVAGRFLQKDPSMSGGSSGQWWVEIDEAKALAKTTQALREGAPKIRQEHQNASGNPTVIKKRKRKASASVAGTAENTVAIKIDTPVMDDATEKMVLQSVKQEGPSLPRYKSEQLLLPTTNYTLALEKLQENVEKAKQEAEQEYKKELVQQSSSQEAVSPQAPIAPLTSNKVFRQMYGQPQQTPASNGSKSSFNPLVMPAIDPFADTPPLMAAPEPDIENDIPVLSLDTSGSNNVTMMSPPPPKRSKLPRVHSLALSEYDGTNIYPATDEPVEFVNPFADESNILVNETTGTNNEKSRLNCRSINGYLNRLLSFSSSSGVATDENNNGPQFRLSDPKNESWNSLGASNSDYFFHDDMSESEGTKTNADATYLESPSLYNEKATTPASTNSSFASLSSMPWINSTSSLIRRSSFSSSRNRGLSISITGRQ